MKEKRKGKNGVISYARRANNLSLPCYRRGTPNRAAWPEFDVAHVRVDPQNKKRVRDLKSNPRPLINEPIGKRLER